MSKFYDDPAKMYDGISAQYGMKLKDPEGTGNDSVFFNFTVYEHGEVRITQGKDFIIMDRDAFGVLVELAREAGVKYQIEF